MSRKDIEAREGQWLKAFNGGDASAVAQIYTEEGRILPPNADIIQGRPGLEAFCKEFFALGASLSFDLLTVHESPDMCVAVGRYELQLEPPGADPENDSGKFVEVWKREADGEWRIADDIFNSSLPAPVA
jgi:uncharacterized protein (TIGR02246 family)